MKKNIKKSEKKENEMETKDEKKNQKTKVVFVEIDDEVTAVYDSIKKLKEQQVLLIIPKEAVLFQSVINFKILKKKADELHKNIYILTKDRIGQHLATEAGFIVSNDIEAVFDLKNNAEAIDKFDIKPITASSNTTGSETFKKLTQSKQNIADILTELRRKYSNKNSFTENIIKKLKKPKIFTDNKIKFSIPNRRALLTLIVLSAIILTISAYIILPGATIYLTPKSDVISQSLNITLADNYKYEAEIRNQEQNIIAMYFYETNLAEKMDYNSTGKIFEGINATGKIKLFNESKNPWPLIPKTRLQTNNGLVFRIQSYTTIPAQNVDGSPGTLDVDVVADETDIFGEIIGDRGNIAPTNFFLPGLNASNQKLLYGKNLASFSGGVTKFQLLVTDKDIFAANELIKNKIIENLKTKLKSEIQSLNNQHHTNFYLILDDRVIQKNKIEVAIPDNLLDSHIPNFEVSAKMHVKVPYFNMDELSQLLREEIIKHTNLKKILVKTFDQNLQFEVIDIDNKNGKIKITATLEGLEEYNLNPETETGKRLNDKIVQNIAGKSIDEATNYIQNITEINKVDIESWPKWAITIPSVTENIKIKVVEK
ncbi:MAG: hypothetical protein UR28_C0020G0009 [Candidatus Peregrinibacteria bacterium GW2011_GWF2_33_10]|nr:MAG: hypothetical protein UR28_C0020G0009 [Candidatus Peregrinibacteria bacterium GW2011_GWF2_33_10]OGJ45312.1 MAG: hypothetical protein A2272_06170 [Candidatus Peregrinibacteria bacterium RIFOXYA12_FULL_33_12]OGJ45396.1 MAG: hypothetical protein A2263_03970 [Candidatus Peregrinibacteria bacterium RIFOXYA2_FULL_33_21]OGJ50999.1 MAG: hypothetical protein A2307_05565 [Candidatus Peregrinibacteria bacterium RIFOXYB2_FULL_33_20]